MVLTNKFPDDYVEITFPESGDFLKIKETLTRIGVSSRNDKKLFQSCHILHKRGKYYIVHFKELFFLDGKTANFNMTDRGRRNTICNLLSEWGLLELVDKEQTQSPTVPLSKIKIVRYKEKNDWELCAKYTIGGNAPSSHKKEEF